MAKATQDQAVASFMEGKQKSAGVTYQEPVTPAQSHKQPDSPAKEKKEKPAESKSDKFRRLANRRVPRAVKCIKAIANLGNASQYEYTTDQTAKIIKAVADAVSEMASALAGKKKSQQEWSI